MLQTSTIFIITGNYEPSQELILLFSQQKQQYVNVNSKDLYMEKLRGKSDMVTCCAPMTTTNRESHKSPSTKNTQITQEEDTNHKHTI